MARSTGPFAPLSGCGSNIDGVSTQEVEHDLWQGSGEGDLPNHVAIIMDGNGRWAKSKGLARTEGHRHGEERLAQVVRDADAVGIRWLTVYGFSTENWSRPTFEVEYIFGLHKRVYARRHEMNANNVRVRCIGRLVSNTSALPWRIRREIKKLTTLTAKNTGLNFTLAFDYGGREELLWAARGVLEDNASVDVQSHLYTPTMPAVDLLIRTSGEYRLSNFLMWETAGAPFYVTPTYWPEFDRHELDQAIEWWRNQH